MTWPGNEGPACGASDAYEEACFSGDGEKGRGVRLRGCPAPPYPGRLRRVTRDAHRVTEPVGRLPQQCPPPYVWHSCT